MSDLILDIGLERVLTGGYYAHSSFAQDFSHDYHKRLFDWRLDREGNMTKTMRTAQQCRAPSEMDYDLGPCVRFGDATGVFPIVRSIKRKYQHLEFTTSIFNRARDSPNFSKLRQKIYATRRPPEYGPALRNRRPCRRDVLSEHGINTSNTLCELMSDFIFNTRVMKTDCITRIPIHRERISDAEPSNTENIEIETEYALPKLDNVNQLDIPATGRGHLEKVEIPICVEGQQTWTAGKSSSLMSSSPTPPEEEDVCSETNISRDSWDDADSEVRKITEDMLPLGRMLNSN